MSEEIIDVLLADDHQIFRQGLAALIESWSEVRVVAQAEDGRDCVELAHAVSPHVVLMDVGMPGLNGADATRQILARDPDVAVLGLSIHRDRYRVENMVTAGARGYVLKTESWELLRMALRSVADGGTFYSAEISRSAASAASGERDPVANAGDRADQRLTLREREVLQLLAEGNSTRSIAAILDISVKTVESHRYNIMNQLDLRNVAALTKYAVSEGLTTLDAPPRRDAHSDRQPRKKD